MDYSWKGPRWAHGTNHDVGQKGGRQGAKCTLGGLARFSKEGLPDDRDR